MEKRKALALRKYDSEAASRPGYSLDAKLVWRSAPVLAVAAAALLIGGHFLSRRRGLDSSLLHLSLEALIQYCVILNHSISVQVSGWFIELLPYVIFFVRI